MPKKTKRILAISSILIFIFLFLPGEFPDNSHLRDVLESVSQDKVVVIFNSGGWGDTPLEEADDFRPIVNGIQETLNKLGYKSIVVPYKRTKNSFLGRIEGLRELFNSFKTQSTQLAKEINYFLKDNPKNKIIMTGLSNGAAFVDKVMEKIQKEGGDKVFAIEVGVPFWEESLNSQNIISLDNEGRDPLSRKKILVLISSLIKAPFRWGLARISGVNLSFSRAFYLPGHQYCWDSPYIGPKISSFLQEKFPSHNLKY